jgi:hypothetical protein
MKLPTLNTPKYSLKVPSTGQTIEYRPFLVKEEKILMLAQESGKPEDVTQAMLDIIHACTFGAIDPQKLASFDLEYIFVKLRTKSVGEDVEVGLKCDSCGALNHVSINLEQIGMIGETKLPKKIMLTDSIGIVPKYISIKDVEAITANQDDKGKSLIMTIAASIASIFDENNVYDMTEASYDEIDTFISSLNRQQLAKIEELIQNSPKFEKDVTFACISCNHENSHKLSGIQSFFE